MKLAIMFPGQGSQSTKMLADLKESFVTVKDAFDEASEALGYNLWNVIDDGSELNKTEITQPAMLVAGFATYQVLTQELNLHPEILAGHSLGEYTALVAAGSIKFSDAVNLVATRGKLMQSAVPAGTGAMAAILGLTDPEVIEVCETTSGIVEAVNFNSPGQIVIAGEAKSVDNACELAKKMGAKRALILPVSVPSHSSLMSEAAVKFKQYLDDIDIVTPKIPVINNVDAKITNISSEIHDALIRQLYSPVQWVNVVRKMCDSGVANLIESGPGKVLTGLSKRIDKSLNILPVFDTASLDKLGESLK